MSEFVPEGWSQAKVGSLSLKVGSGVTPRGGSKAYSTSGVKFIRSQNVHFTGLKLNDVVYISQDIHDSMLGSQLQDNDVLLNITGASIGRCTFVPNSFGAANVNQHVCIIRPNEKIKSAYLSQWFSSDSGQNAIMRYQAGGNREGLNFQQIRSMIVTLPPLPEQQKIAAILTSVDEVIEKTQAQINKLKDLKTGMMQELLTRGVGVDGKLHTEFKDSPVGRIPKGWEVKRFSDLIFSSNQGVNTTTEKVTYSETGIPAIRSNNVDENIFDMSNRKYVSYELFERLSGKVKPKFDDVLYCNIGSDLGAAAIVNVKNDFLITWNVLRIVSNTSVVLPKFLSYLLNHNRKELRKSATESTMPFISSKALSKYNFLIPNVNEQSKIVSVLESLDSRQQKVVVKLKHYKKLKKALMQDLLTGKVRVKVDS